MATIADKASTEGPEYEPTSRRPIADLFRRTATAAVGVCVRRGVHPDAISYASIVAAAAAGACFWLSGRYPLLLLVAPLFCYIRLWMNMLDGMVALAADKASARGEILNDLPDRVSDLLIFVGVAHSGLCHPLGGYWAAIFALLTAYVGLFGQAVGAKRQFGGIMSKPWRMVVLHAGAWGALALMWAGGAGPEGAVGANAVAEAAGIPGAPAGATPVIGSLGALDVANLVVIVGCMQTIVVRLRRIMLGLSQGGPIAKGG